MNHKPEYSGFVLMSCKSFPFRKLSFPMWIIYNKKTDKDNILRGKGFRRYEEAQIYAKLKDIEHSLKRRK